jgi:tRNA(Ile)-lysidine synthase TilS/MesJ
MVLLHILCQCGTPWDWNSWLLILNHDLRPEADQEEEMVQQVCRSWDVPFFAQKVE